MKKAAFIIGASMIPAAASFAAPSFFTSSEDTDGPGYTYVQGQYIPQGKLENAQGGEDKDYDGYGFDVSYEFPANLILQGGYDRLELSNSSIDVNRANVGLGTHYFIDYGGAEDTGVDIYGLGSYERLEFRNAVGGDDATGTGYSITAGLRWMVDPQVEINPHAKWVDYGSISGGQASYGSPDGFEYGLQLVGYLSEDQHLALTAGYDRTDVDYGPQDANFRNEVSVGARYNF